MSECIFCRIISGDVKSNVLHSDDDVFAIEDINPQAPVHFLVIPKKHIPTTIDIGEEDHNIMGLCLSVANRIVSEKGIDTSGFRIVLNSGSDAGQSIHHLHFHVMGGRPMKWPPG
jgi:histidine triad (HIT) family protein